MTKESIYATFRMLDEGIGLIDIGEDPNDYNQRTLSHAFIEATGSHPKTVILNFRRLPHINSVDLALLIGWITRTRQKKIRCLAFGLNHSLYEVFRLVGLNEQIDICSTGQDVWHTLGIPVPDEISTARDPIKHKPEETWAEPVSVLQVHGMPANAIDLNVVGRKPSGPLAGFGQLWQKTYQVILKDVTVTPGQIIQTWKKEFSKFWPKGNHYFGPAPEILPGQVSILHLAGPGGMNYPGGLPFIATGVLVIHANEDSFAFLSVEGHMIAGMITFTSYKDANGFTVIQLKALGRASDPLYELIFRLGLGHAIEDGFWIKSLQKLAICFGASGKPESTIEYLDRQVQWSRVNNIWKNAAVGTMKYVLLLPFRWLGNLVKVNG
jgi:anti-anti-sigma regulatory factor